MLDTTLLMGGLSKPIERTIGLVTCLLVNIGELVMEAVGKVVTTGLTSVIGAGVGMVVTKGLTSVLGAAVGIVVTTGLTSVLGAGGGEEACALLGREE